MSSVVADVAVSQLIENTKSLSLRSPNNLNESPLNTEPSEDSRNPNNMTIFVGSIPFEASEEEIRRYFSDCGNIVTIRLLLNNSNRFKGSCFIRFDSIEAAAKACQLDGHTFRNRTLYVSMSTSRAAIHSPPPRLPPPDGCKTVFVGNLDLQLQEGGIANALSSCGSIHTIKLIKDRTNGQSKGFAFVEFNDPEGATNAVNLNGKVVNGRPMKIDYQRPRSTQYQKPPDPSPPPPSQATPSTVNNSFAFPGNSVPYPAYPFSVPYGNSYASSARYPSYPHPYSYSLPIPMGYPLTSPSYPVPNSTGYPAPPPFQSNHIAQSQTSAFGNNGTISSSPQLVSSPHILSTSPQLSSPLFIPSASHAVPPSSPLPSSSSHMMSNPLNYQYPYMSIGQTPNYQTTLSFAMSPEMPSQNSESYYYGHQYNVIPDFYLSGSGNNLGEVGREGEGGREEGGRDEDREGREREKDGREHREA